MKSEIGIDIGGTFTDLVCRDEEGAIRIRKIPSTPKKPSVAAINAVDELSKLYEPCENRNITRIVHGTTVATNAVLERKGAKIGLITTKGFRDVIEIGRQWRQSLYEAVLEPETPAVIIPRALRLEVQERTSSDGTVITPLDENELKNAANKLVSEGVEAVAICFLFSFLNPTSEMRARSIIENTHPGLLTSLSCEVDPAFREYERCAITVFDAYVKPVVDQYLVELETSFKLMGDGLPLQIMHSRGGLTGPEIARARPVRLFLSGPAAGVIGAKAVAENTGNTNVISLDIGGTSADIALISGGKPLLRAEGVIGGFPVRLPMVDINTIGAGGGSVAWLDTAKGLHVGPESSGSDPGPACYGMGGKQPTVSDASLVLGYLNADYFAAGKLQLDVDLAYIAIKNSIADPLGMSVEEAALGIHTVVNSQMAEGIRLVSVRQGYDPRDFVLVPFGGAGPVHAIALAQELGLAEIIVPRYPGVLSASGLLGAPVEHEVSAAYPYALKSIDQMEIKHKCLKLDTQCSKLMDQDEVDQHGRQVSYYADVCYEGQSFYIETPFFPDLSDCITDLYRAFRLEHERMHGHSTDNPARIVNLRTIHRGQTMEVPQSSTGGSSTERSSSSRNVYFSGYCDAIETIVLSRDSLEVGKELIGPMIIEQEDTTIVIEPLWKCIVENGHILKMNKN